jgi:hypothetical protein
MVCKNKNDRYNKYIKALEELNEIRVKLGMDIIVKL